MKEKPDIQLKFVFVGDSRSGKTSLFNRMTKNKFQPQNDFIVSDFAFSFLNRNKKSIKVTFWDTISQEKYRISQPNYYKNANVIFICYDMSSYYSSNNLEQWIREGEKHISEDSFIAIVGCKQDLDHEANQNLIEKLAKKYQYEHFQTSSWTGQGIQDLFQISIQSCVNNSSLTSKRLSRKRINSKNKENMSQISLKQSQKSLNMRRNRQNSKQNIVEKSSKAQQSFQKPMQTANLISESQKTLNKSSQSNTNSKYKIDSSKSKIESKSNTTSEKTVPLRNQQVVRQYTLQYPSDLDSDSADSS